MQPGKQNYVVNSLHRMNLHAHTHNIDGGQPHATGCVLYTSRNRGGGGSGNVLTFWTSKSVKVNWFGQLTAFEGWSLFSCHWDYALHIPFAKTITVFRALKNRRTEEREDKLVTYYFCLLVVLRWEDTKVYHYMYLV